jgi:DNA-binding transcriptional LysR family regulator
MDLDWLKDFLVLAEKRNFSRAADARNVTQPAFSRRIRALEDWIGTARRRSHAGRLPFPPDRRRDDARSASSAP